MKSPVVSVVTPFYNSAAYLEECIESVLAQTYGDFEYVLVDNKSTDDSKAIAERYSKRDPRLRLFENDRFVGQVDNYNGALARVSPGSRYVKMVQADDALFPDCLRLMVDVAERDPRIGIVSSFYLKGEVPTGSGVPHGAWRMDGTEVLRRMLVGNAYALGSPTTVMYRADIVRGRTPFYALGRYHEDTETAYEILLDHDLGFVHQILSFLRTDNISIMSAARRFDPVALDHLIVLERFGPKVLTEAEFERQRTLEWRAYRGFLGASVLGGRGEDFWKYHREGLRTMGHTLRGRDLIVPTMKQLARLLLNPLDAAAHRVGELRKHRGR